MARVLGWLHAQQALYPLYCDLGPNEASFKTQRTRSERTENKSKNNVIMETRTSIPTIQNEI